MKITKFGHSCLLVEMPAPVNRTALFDPGSWSVVDVDKLEYLDDIFVTHRHGDHMDAELIKKLQAKFPDVRVTVPADAVTELEQAGLQHVSTDAPDGVRFFGAPHEIIRPLMDADPPQENGIHYLEKLSHPGDSHSFRETMPVLALPVSAPWGATVTAARLGLDLRPKYILPIHDWHWRNEAREGTYAGLEKMYAAYGITFLKLTDGEPVVIDI